MHPQVTEIVSIVLERCKQERDNKIDINLEDYEERAAFYTGIPKDTIKNVMEIIKKSEHLNILTVFEILSVLRILKDYYVSEQTPSFIELYEKFTSVCPPKNATNVENLIFNLKKIGINYKKTTTGFLLMEEPKYTFERFMYLKKIREYRKKNHPIYYIDERIFDHKFEIIKPWIESDDPETWSENYERYIFLHMISKTNYENGLFCFNMKEETFNKWIVDIILPQLPQSSVIVLDRSPLHGKKGHHKISRYHPKRDMLKWLKDLNVPCTEKMHKAELFQLIEKCPKKTNNYKLENILKAHGHTLLYLPQHFSHLSPTEFLWQNVQLLQTIKDFNSENMLCNLQLMVDGLLRGIDEKEWMKFNAKIEELENLLFENDLQIDEALQKYDLDISSADFTLPDYWHILSTDDKNEIDPLNVKCTSEIIDIEDEIIVL